MGMPVLKRLGLRGTVIALGIVLVLMMLGGPDRAAAQDDPTPSAHITVQVSSGKVSWSDPHACSSDYHIYRNSGTDRYLLGSADSGTTEATVNIPGVGSVQLYCGEYDPESSENVLVASTEYYAQIQGGSGTYSSAPLTALSISSGTLSPTFDRGIFTYAAEVASDVGVITLDPTALIAPDMDTIKNMGSRAQNSTPGEISKPGSHSSGTPIHGASRKLVGS